ncbi:MAG: cupin domain-containing protein [Caulobacterales bacterium]|nr:cupin domain-containing protein [Caulobacterales bacterium]
MLGAVTRWVTGHDAEGRSVVIARSSLATDFVNPDTGEGAADIWISPAVPERVEGAEVRDTGRFVLNPPEGGVTTRIFAVAPGEARSADLAGARAAARSVYGAIEGGEALIDSDRHPAMHRTRTLDVVVVVQGVLTLVLDKEDVVLRPGDSVVQRATSHAWANHGDELAVAAVVMIDARR